MSQEHQVLRTIEWRSVFPFTQLFQSFRVAIHPAKLVLALLAILLVYCAGRALDAIGPDRYAAVPGEIGWHESHTPRATFVDHVQERRKELLDERKQIEASLRAETLRFDPKRSLEQDLPVSKLESLLAESRQREIDRINGVYNASAKLPKDIDARNNQIRATYDDAARTHQQLLSTRPRGVFATFLDYQIDQVDSIARGVFEWNWTGETGVLAGLQRFVFIAPGWALARHPVHAIFMTFAGLFVWSIFGGAIARIAAVHVARDEKISVRQALRFSISKLMSFFMAPLMPLILISLVALILAALGWLSELRFVGGIVSIAIGLLFVLLIGIGVLVACAVVGTICGAGLMYPTIAVEGSDAFDAVSRSFSYVFARPWKIAIYTFIGIVYAAFTYVFLRFMIFLTLSLLHTFLTLWAHDVGPDGTASIANAWRGPSGLFNLYQPPDLFSLTFSESIAAWAVTFWAYLFIALLGAYLLSFFVSVNTIAYYLLRYDVDAAEIDDVYLEPTEDDFEDAPIDTPITQTVAVDAGTPEVKSAKAESAPTKVDSSSPRRADVTEAGKQEGAGDSAGPTPPPAGA